MSEYDPKNIEPKWQKEWADTKLYQTEEGSDKPKCYVLDEFPYPSGEGLHTGHTRIYTASDIYARMKRMQGYNVLHPSGWDAFGLPAEQFAIKHKVHPSESVQKNTERYKTQMNRVGLSYDWEREINTTDPKFYKWTQWAFLKMFERGLAFESFEPINWCPTCQTGLANEDLDGANCERCGTLVEKKPMRQWVIRITDYADRLIDDLETLPDWPEAVKEAQRNWIGRSQGSLISFALTQTDADGIPQTLEVFTTRPDTLFGVTYLAISAELAKNWIEVGWQASEEIKMFITQTLQEESKRTFDAEVVDKKGVATGIFAVNPANQEKIPVWIANYVLSGYGTGAIMAVPAHDERDFEFAQKYKLPIKQVVVPTFHNNNEATSLNHLPYIGDGVLKNSAGFDGIPNEEGEKRITEFVGGTMTKQYRLNDWVFSRQRYWGEPIPVVHCPKDGVVAIPENELPLTLPEVDSYEPTGTGESPLAAIASWVNTTCPKCGGPATRETNTMPQWAGSSWYYLRFMDPHNPDALVGKDKEKYWAPVDVYVGGAEHVTRHLIYARFWHKFLYDIGVVSTLEPFARRRGVGLVLGEGGVKMSKRLGNVINPDDIIDTFGADSLRIYEMFMGPFGAAIPWSTDNLIGARRFVERVWKLGSGSAVHLDIGCPSSLETLYHQTIKKVTDDIEEFKFNTAISQLMIFVNMLDKEEKIPQQIFGDFLKLLAPFAPHITEELWANMGNRTSIHREVWPHYDSEKILSDTITIGIQINGKLRDTMEINRASENEEVKEAALKRPGVMKWLEGKTPKKVIYIEGKILSIVL